MTIIELETAVARRRGEHLDRLSDDEYQEALARALGLVEATADGVDAPHSFAYFDDLGELVERRGALSALRIA